MRRKRRGRVAQTYRQTTRPGESAEPQHEISMKAHTPTELTQWKCHLPRLLIEIASNPECAALVTPLNILREIIVEVAQRAAELNDPQLSALMCRLALYDQSDPESTHYDRDMTAETIRLGNEARVALAATKEQN